MFRWLKTNPLDAEVPVVSGSEQLCAKHYDFKDRASCFKCPLIDLCHKSSGSTQESLDAHKAAMNNLADKFLKGEQA